MSKAPLQYSTTGIQKYVLDWLGNQIGGTEEPPPPKLTRRSEIKVLMLAFSIWGLEKLKHLWKLIASIH